MTHWITWAINEFKLQHVQPETFANLTGKDLCEMKHDEFSKLVMNDRRDIFWTHLELLRKCRFVGKLFKPLNLKANVVLKWICEKGSFSAVIVDWAAGQQGK